MYFIYNINVARFFSHDEVKQFEDIYCSPSGGAAKLNGFSDVIEPAKCRALMHFDYFFPSGDDWKKFRPETPDYARDHDITQTREDTSQTQWEYKLQLKTFHDRLNHKVADVSDYCVLKMQQFERYKNNDNRMILYERLICNFDQTTRIGTENVSAFVNFAKKAPEQTWEYLIFHTDDLRDWKQGRDYKIAYPNKHDKKNWMIIFNKKNCRKRKDLTTHLNDAHNRGLLMGVKYNYVNGHNSKTLDTGIWQ